MATEWAKWRKPTRRQRCVALDSSGKRCARMAAWVGPYHGDGETVYRNWDGNDVTWVVVHLCGTHASRVK